MLRYPLKMGRSSCLPTYPNATNLPGVRYEVNASGAAARTLGVQRQVHLIAVQ